MRRLAQEAHLPAKRIRAFVQFDLVPTLGRCARSLHTCGASADHDDAPAVCPLSKRLPANLAAGTGIVDATDVTEALLAAEAAFIAVDTFTYLVAPARYRLHDDLRLGGIGR